MSNKPTNKLQIGLPTEKTIPLQDAPNLFQTPFNISSPASGGAPKGTIIMWNFKNDPPGWFPCDGKIYNGVQTPNLQGRFIMGAGNLSGTNSTYSLGQDGGQEQIKLSASEIPAHKHGYNDDKFVQKQGDWLGEGKVQESAGYAGLPGSSEKYTQNNTGGGGAHENRPPYYVLRYLMFCGYR